MEKILLKAKEASTKAYAPYSKFNVGCALEFKDGNFVLGANVENASFGATQCAERSAIGTMFSMSFDPKAIKSIALYNKKEKLCFPCGICRQVISELFNSDVKIIIGNNSKNKEITVGDLLPFAFGKENLDV